MARRWRLALLVSVFPIPSPPTVSADDPPELTMSKPIVCAKILGFANVEPLPDASLTADDKLTVYYEPSGYKIEQTRDGYHAVFAQDGRLRKKGGKDALWQKAPMFEYEAKAVTAPERVYMRSDLSIKGLPPGEYELDLTLHDRLAKGGRVMKTVGFKVVPDKGEEGGGAPKADGKKRKAGEGAKGAGVKSSE